MKILKEKTVSFVSRSVELDNYEIFTILQFDWDFYNSFYALSGRNKFDRESLLDSLIGIFLEESLDTMYRPRAAASPQLITIDKREVFRIATSNFVSSANFKACKSQGSFEFLHTCNYVSSQIQTLRGQLYTNLL